MTPLCPSNPDCYCPDEFTKSPPTYCLANFMARSLCIFFKAFRVPMQQSVSIPKNSESIWWIQKFTKIKFSYPVQIQTCWTPQYRYEFDCKTGLNTKVKMGLKMALKPLLWFALAATHNKISLVILHRAGPYNLL